MKSLESHQESTQFLDKERLNNARYQVKKDNKKRRKVLRGQKKKKDDKKKQTEGLTYGAGQF